MAQTPNKNYALQVTGTNVGTWGTVLNNNVFSIVDANLGGTLAINVGGSANINLTASQAEDLIHNLTGVLLGNIQYIFPAQGGFYAINNQTTGAFTITVNVVGGSGGVIVPQGTAATVYIDATVPAVYGLGGTQGFYVGGPVTGTANALIVATTTPATFTRIPGTLLSFFPTSPNTGSATLTTPDGLTGTIQKVTPTGLVNLAGEEMAPTIPVIALWNGSVWIDLEAVYFGTAQKISTNQSLGFTALFNSYIASAPVFLTISRTATTLPPYWWIEGNALGGSITIVPDSHDSINVNGVTLAAGVSYVVPQGGTFKLSTDSNGNLYILFISAGGVTSVNVSGGTTGITASGGPITSSGTITLAGTLIPANGGTGLSSVGASGNVLTSNGTTWSSSTLPTATNSVLGVVKPDGTSITISSGIISAGVGIMTPLAVGSIIWAAYNSASAVTAGNTVAAATLNPQEFINTSGNIPLGATGDSLSGTWLALQSHGTNAGATLTRLGLFQRTA